MTVGFPSPLVLLPAWIVGSVSAYDATKDCTFEFYNRSVYGATRNPGCDVKNVREKETITFDLLNFGAETVRLGVYQNYSNGGGMPRQVPLNTYQQVSLKAECSEPPVLEFGTESCTFRLTGKDPQEGIDYDQLIYSPGGTCHPDLHYVQCQISIGDCTTPWCHKGVSWVFRVERVKGCPFFHNERNDSIASDALSDSNWWFVIWNADKLSKTDPNYGWLKRYDFFMFDFDEDGDNQMPDFFVRKVNNPKCTYFQFHLVSRRGWRPLPK